MGTSIDPIDKLISFPSQGSSERPITFRGPNVRGRGVIEPAARDWPQTGNSMRQHSAWKRWAGGFTLLELLVVVAIIGLLAAYVGPRYFGQIGKSEQALARAQIEGFHRAIATFRLDVGRYPSTEEGLAALTNKPANATGWNGPYLNKAAPRDPWAHPYVYRAPGQKGDYDLLSLGKDNQPGGTGDAADIGGD